MSFDSDLKAFAAKVAQRRNDIFVSTAQGVKDSITDGSAVTASPGQPVDTGRLKGSWQLTFETPTVALVATDVEYARPIEEGVGSSGPMTLRSEVGGFHSVALTRTGFQRLTDHVVKEVVG